MTPHATYRIQFHRDFGFEDAARLAPYLRGLGVSHLYASPIARARKGSMHGYDVVDPTIINPELGGEDGFRRLVAALRAEGIGVILDIVPNHMAVGGSENLYWQDVLKNGEASRYARVFDIDWRPAHAALHGKVLAPFLGRAYGEALVAGDLKLEVDPASGEAWVSAYGTHRFPLRAEDLDALAADGLAQAPERHDPASPEGRGRLHALLERQHYRLASWQVAGDEINWRRFFDVTELAGVRVEDPDVFEILHALPLRLFEEGLVEGLRADHIDGLADPSGYCLKLRGRLRDAARRGERPHEGYFIVEKILARGERLSPEWGVDGTTGYDFMELVSALQHAPSGEAPLGDAWREVSGRSSRFPPEERAARAEVVSRSFSGQLAAAARAFARLANARLETRDLTEEALRRSLRLLLEVFPCYRTYGFGTEVDAEDRGRLQEAVRRARPLAAPGEGALLDQIARWVLGEDLPEDRLTPLASEAVRRLQQLTAPVSAKSVEDTAFYRYGRLLSRTDVGFDPDRFAVSVPEFHARMVERQETFPATLNATATHDHKRGEDVRARLAVLSEAPYAFLEAARRWRGLGDAQAHGVDPGDEHILHQVLVGALPLTLKANDVEGLKAFRTRIEAWLQKALREAKLRDSWTAPDAGYERACSEFVEELLDRDRSPAFLTDLFSFVADLAPAGAFNSLVQAGLKCLAPGVPDTYQGCEFWDFSLVDPDNRRPVDFAAREIGLAEADTDEALMAAWRDGRLKQRVIRDALSLRKSRAALFRDGAYRPLETIGQEASRVLAFLRGAPEDGVLVAAPVQCASVLIGAERPLLDASFWKDTAILAPRSSGSPRRLLASDLFRRRPFAAFPLEEL